MAIMEQELAEMINFWGYDKGAAEAEVKTDFFDVEPNENAVNFRSHNEDSCLSLCGQMSSLNTTYKFDKDGDYERIFFGKHRMYDKITIK